MPLASAKHSRAYHLVSMQHRIGSEPLELEVQKQRADNLLYLAP